MIPALVRHVVESTVFATLVAIFPTFLMRRRSAAARHAVWLVAASKFALPTALLATAGEWLRSLLPARPLLSASSVMVPGFLPGAGSVPATSGSTGWAPALLLAFWIAGTAVMLVVWLRGVVASEGAVAAAPEPEAEALSRMQWKIGLHRRVELRSSRSHGEPGIRGVRRLTITIPEGLSLLLAPREFDAVLIHELAHAKRRDNLTRGFVHALVCLFWFDPILWWIERRIIAEQELASDEFVLCHGTDSEEYADGILKVCRACFAGGVTGVCGIAGPNLKSRLEAIMSFKPNRLNQRAPWFLVGVFASAMIIVPLAIGFLAATPALGQAASARLSASASASSEPATCTYDGKAFPIGAVIQVRNLDGQRMCVEDLHRNSFWMPISAEARQRTQRVITVDSPPAPICKPARSTSPKNCACQDGLYSIGAIVHTASGAFLRCDKGKWRPATPAERGLR